MENFIYDYFISPIWDRTGYNTINTVAYVLIALAALWVLYGYLKSRIKFDEAFIGSILCFVLFGSTARVVTDAIDGGNFLPISPIHEFVLNSHIWDYGYLTVTPGIYIVTAALLMASFLILRKIGRPGLLGYVGIALWLPHFLLLLPFFGYWIYSLPILVLTVIPGFFAWRHFKDKVLSGIVAGQALDGAATFFIIDYFSKISGISYFEQHVFSAAIGNLFGTFFVFYLIKVGIALAAAYILSKEKQEVAIAKLFGRELTVDRNFIAMVIMIIGFAPGIRDILRMMAGT